MEGLGWLGGGRGGCGGSWWRAEEGRLGGGRGGGGGSWWGAEEGWEGKEVAG